MEYRRETNGLWTFMEHWWLLTACLIFITTFAVLSFFTNLNGERWVHFFVASEVLLVVGVSLIIRAKIPVFRSGRFFTFGPESIPKNVVGYYRWGWRVFLFGVALSLCLLLSKQ